ncbi:MAG: Fic family protein [Rhodobacteraceae bacterium]|nr:Fic family protein [Paracoccaceae bacterium]
MANWERYIHETEEVDPLIRLAVMHYQFEAIHPFVDGNGRTGRILNLLYLIDKGLLDTPVLYLSRYIIQHKALYYRYLLEVTARQDWERWILFILEAVRTTAESTTSKIHAIRELLDKTGATIRRTIPKIYSRELTELLFVHPYCRIGDIVKADIAKRQTAAAYLKALVVAGLLEEIKAGREKLYINPPLLVLLAGRT